METVVFPTKKTVTYSCKSQLPGVLDPSLLVGQFPSGIGDGCTVSIWLKRRLSSKSYVIGAYSLRTLIQLLDLVVEKSDETPMTVDMTLQITKMGDDDLLERTQSFETWTKYCNFDDMEDNVRSPDAQYRISVKITWTIPDSYSQISHFFMNQTLSDVTIVIGDNKLFAHKLVLGAASPVLLAMLTTPMKEARDHCIVIKDVGIDTMKAVLKLLYTGKDGEFDNVEIALEGLIFAEEYDMGKLKELCEQKILKNLTADNVLTVLDVADTHRAGALVRECMRVIVDHKNDIIYTEAFKELYLKKPLLMMQFTINVMNDTK